MAADSLVGTYRLVAVYYHGPDGEREYPFGREVSGFITYTDAGFVQVNLGAANRQRHVHAGQDLRAGDVSEKAAAFDTFLSYAGRYDLRAGAVYHHIEVCSFPNWVGADVVRYPEFREDGVTLRTAPFVLGGVEQTSYFVWERLARN